MTRASSIGWALAAGATIASSACAADDGPVEGEVVAHGVLAPVQPDCWSQVDATSSLLEGGRLDVAFSVRYMADVSVENREHPIAGAPASLLIAQAQAADVTLFENGVQIASFTVIANGAIDPGAFGRVSFEPIPPSIGVVLENTIRAGPIKRRTLQTRFVLRGTFVAGGAWRTDEVAYPIDVCHGCSVVFSPEENDPTFPSPNCFREASFTPFPCHAGQDEPMDCYHCQGLPACTLCGSDAQCGWVGSATCGAGGVCL